MASTWTSTSPRVVPSKSTSRRTSCPVRGYTDEGRASRMVDTLENTDFGLSDERLTPVPSYDRYGFAFFPTRYWRGPVWVNINWLLMRGLQRYGYEEQAQRLRGTILSLCRDQGS